MEWNEIKKGVLIKDAYNGEYRGFYSIISEKGYGISKDLLIRIIQELDYAIYEKLDSDDYNEIIETSVAEIDTHFDDDDSE